MDKIVVSNLIVFANHGVFNEEKVLGQKFLIDIELFLDTQIVAISNDLEKSVNYGVLSEEISKLFKEKSNDLIETCAEELAIFILSKYNMVKEVVLKVKKPWAPVGLPLDDVFVEVKRKRRRAFLSLGSNVGDSKNLLENAIIKIEDSRTKVLKKSKVYQTKAWGLEEQPDFLNQVIEIETFYEPRNLLLHLQKIELELGRERKIHWGPRTMDIDILFIDNEIIYEDNLIIPHPYIQERQFVLEPLMDIGEHFIHPVLGKSIRILLKELRKV